MHELEKLTEPELRSLIDRGLTTVVVPFGSVEQHGAHMPLGADGLLADAVGPRVATRLNAILAPTVHTGYAPEHGSALSVRPGTLADLAFDLAESLASQGIRVITLVSTHGGNARPLEAAVERANGVLDGVIACAPKGDVGPEPGTYSGEWLTSVLLAVAPDLVDLAAADSKLTEELRLASAERGAAHLELFVGSIVDRVHTVMRSAGIA